MALSEYQQKRHFDKTPEPEAKVARRTGRSYVVQKHAASHLHYDFRLELDGVLKSWAVPKGPCLDPSIKRLAMQVEDHPVDYGAFEGIIPAGEYGGGTVMLWDTGEWEPIGDPHEGYRQGKLKFQLRGQKLTGGWALIRTHHDESRKNPQWLLIKEKDAHAQPVYKADVLLQSPLSVVSGRDLDEIAASRDQIWSSKSQPVTAARKSKQQPSPSKPLMDSTGLSAATQQPLPTHVKVQLATLTQAAPSGDQWLHEVKFDGYRMLCRVDGKQCRFISRNDQDWTSRLRTLSAAVRELPVKQAIIDGEVVVMKADGTTDFQALQNAFRDNQSADLQYYVFDLLYLDGKSLVPLPLEVRKTLLAKLVSGLKSQSPIHYSEHVIGSGPEFQAAACRRHLEGSISKLRDQPYRAGRGYDWLKVKCVHTDEFVIGGYTDPSGARLGFGTLLMGYYDTAGKLHYAGKVGTGFGQRDLMALHRRLHALERTKSPFIDRLEKIGQIRTAHWTAPTLVAQISYGSRTRDGILRHASFAGLREDKPATEVFLDQPVPVQQAVEKAGAESAPKTASRKTASVKNVDNKTASGKKAGVKKAGVKTARPPSVGGKQSLRRTSPTTSVKHEVSGQSDYNSSLETFAGARLTHPEKVLYPEEGITKLELASYYQDISDWILPHVKHRPLVLVRCPDGCGGTCFYQKHPGVGTPETLRQIPIREANQTGNYVLIDDVDGLISLAQIGALEVHAWGSQEDKLERPNRLVFDLDPSPEVPWTRVVDGARGIRRFLQDLGLESFVKTTGGKGLHLVVPIERRHNWDEAKAFCKAVATAIVAVAPHQYTSNMSKAARTNKIFLDYLRNGRGATAVVPFSPRARPGAPISMPVDWDELSPSMHSDFFTIRTAAARLANLKHDPWKMLTTLRQSLSTPIKTLTKLGVSERSS